MYDPEEGRNIGNKTYIFPTAWKSALLLLFNINGNAIVTVSPQSRIVSSRAENIYLAPEKIGYKKVNPVIWQGVSKADVQLLRATRGACNPNLQAVIRHASHVCSQHSFGLPLRMYGMHRTHFDHAYLDLVSLVIWTFVFWPSVTWNLRKEQRYSKSVLTFDRCHLHSVTFGYY